MAPGFLTLHEPGQSITVTLTADANGTALEHGLLLEITGENSSHTEMSVVENAGGGVATLETIPTEYDESASYADGDVIGEATVLLRHPVDWVYPSTAASLSAGDVVASDVGGTVDAFDSAGGDTGNMAIGPVFTTLARGAQTADKVAVVRQR